RQLLPDLQHLKLDLRRGADRRRRAIVFVGIGTGERDEFLDGLRRQGGFDDERIGRRRKLADADEILIGVEGQVFVEPIVYRIRIGREQDRIAVGLSVRRIAKTYVAARAA